jgi:hypothetical protein
LGIGTSSPSNPLHVATASTDVAKFATTGAYNFISLDNATRNWALSVGSAFGIYDATAASTRMAIDSSGHLLVGTTNASNSVAGFRAYSGGNGAFTIAGQPLELNRLSSDGSILGFQKDGAPVGSIGVNAGSIAFGQSNTAIGAFNTDRILFPATASGVVQDNAIDLGYSNGRFKDLYLSGGVYLGGTGAANKLDDYEEGTWTGTLTGSTSAPSTAITATGTYTKIGRSVTAVIAFSNKDSTGVAGNIIITGLPFTAAAGGVGAGWHSRSNTGTGTTNGVMSYIASNNDLVLVQGLGSAITWATTGTGTYAGYSITYEV